MPSENRDDLDVPPPNPKPPPIEKGWLEPKNSANMSSAFLGLKLNCPDPFENVEGPPAPGGGTCPFKPSSPY